MKNCTGTLYTIGGKTYCVGEKMIRKKNGRTITITNSKTSKKSKTSKTSKKSKTLKTSKKSKTSKKN